MSVTGKVYSVSLLNLQWIMVVDEPEWFLVPLCGTSQTIYFCKAEYLGGFRHPRHLGLQQYIWQLVPPSGTNKPKSSNWLMDYGLDIS